MADDFETEIIRTFHEEERRVLDRFAIALDRLEDCSDEDREKIEAVLGTGQRRV